MSSLSAFIVRFLRSKGTIIKRKYETWSHFLVKQKCFTQEFTYNVINVVNAIDRMIELHFGFLIE